MAAQELLEGAGQLARRARISGLVALCAVELCFLWVSIKSDVKVQRCYFYYTLTLGSSVAPKTKNWAMPPPEAPSCSPAVVAGVVICCKMLAGQRAVATLAAGPQTSTAVPSRRHPTRMSMRSLHPDAQTLCAAGPAARRSADAGCRRPTR